MPAPPPRLHYLDNLKLFVFIVVIINHVGIGLGPNGGLLFWPYHCRPEEELAWLGDFYAISAAYVMGLFFMISGFFLPVSYDKAGGKGFLQKKLSHLGPPLLLVALLLNPLQMYQYYLHFSGNPPVDYWQYFTQLYLGIGGRPQWYVRTLGIFPEVHFGWLWYVEHLLLYSVLYWLVRKAWGNRGGIGLRVPAGWPFILAQCVLVAGFTVLIRRHYPPNAWIGLFRFIQMEPAHFPMYLACLVTGILARRQALFERIGPREGSIVLALALAMAAGRFVIPWLSERQAAFVLDNWAVYESFMGVFLCWGLLVLFREKVNFRTPLLGLLAGLSLAAYILHAPIVVAVQYGFDRNLAAYPYFRYFFACFLSVIASFLAAFILKKTPVIKKFLG